MSEHKTQAQARALTERATAISQSRYCRSCAVYRKPEGGVLVPIKGSNNTYWRCAGCQARRSEGRRLK